MVGGVDRRERGDRGDELRRRARQFVQEPIIREAAVPLPAVRVEDPEVCAPPRRPEMVPSDHHLGPLADDVTSEADPRPPGPVHGPVDPVDGVRGVGGAAADAQEEEPAFALSRGRQNFGDPFDGVGVEQPDDARRLIQMKT